MKKDMWLWIIGGAIVLYWAYSQGYFGSLGAGSGSSTTTDS